MKLILLDDEGKVVDSYEDIEEYDLDDPDTPFGLITWLRKSIKRGLKASETCAKCGGHKAGDVCTACGELEEDCDCEVE